MWYLRHVCKSSRHSCSSDRLKKTTLGYRWLEIWKVGYTFLTYFHYSILACLHVLVTSSQLLQPRVLQTQIQIRAILTTQLTASAMVLTHKDDPIQCCITTFNCGRELVDVDYFASSLHSALKPFEAPPDLIVLALQEIAPIGSSFLGGRFIKSYFDRFSVATHLAARWSYTREIQYERVLVRSVGLTGIMVFARHEVKRAISSVRAAGTGVGVMDMGNKGAVAVRLAIEGMQFTFVSAHLAPGEEECERRNADWRKICENLVFELVEPHLWKETGEEGGEGRKAVQPPPQARAGPSQGESDTEPLLPDSQRENVPDDHQAHALFTPVPSYVFFAGDLNYRTSDTPPKPEDSKNWPQPLASEDDPLHHKHLLEKDQLTRELREGRTLHHLAEAPITFPPTYKYSSKAQELAAANARVPTTNAGQEGPKGRCNSLPTVNFDERQDQVWLWARHRMPSWCDRILYLSDLTPRAASYKALPVQPTSDHRPVLLSFGLYRIPPPRPKPQPFELVEGWKQRRAVARKLEILVGIPSYLLLVGHGQLVLLTTALLAAIVYFSIRAFTTA